MSVHRATRAVPAPAPTGAAEERTPAGPVVLFITAVVIAGLTCILYLWQQSHIVATQQDLSDLNRQLVVLQQQENNLVSQEQVLTSVTHVVAQANRYGMTQGVPGQFIHLTVPAVVQSPTVAQVSPSRQPAVLLPATNAAITSWWQGAWDGLFGLLQ